MKCSTCGEMNCMAHGGDVEDESEQGFHVKQARKFKVGKDSDDAYSMEESEHHNKMAKKEQMKRHDKMRKLPRPKLQGLAKGGHVKGVHEESPHKRGASQAGEDFRALKDAPTKEEHYRRRELVMGDREAKLEELQNMPKPKLHGLAKGGSVDEGPSEKANQSGVHKIVPNYDRKHNEIKHGQSEARYENKKAKHHEVLGELRSMPNPKLKGLAEGGEVEDMDTDSDQMDNEINDMVAGELLEAIEKKDKAAILQSIKALVMNCGGK